MANIVGELNGPQLVTVLPSAARTATPANTNEYILTGKFRGLIVVVDVTAVTSTPSTVISIQGVDRVSGKTYAILDSAALVATGTTVLRVGAGLTAAANLVANDLVPPFIRIVATHGNANSMTYSVSAMICV